MRALAAHTEDELPSWGGHQVDVVDALRRGQRGQGGRRAGAGGHSVEPSPRRGPAGVGVVLSPGVPTAAWDTGPHDSPAPVSHRHHGHW